MSKIDPFLNVPELQGMNRDEKERIDYFLKSPGKKEFFFFLQTLGKTPAQVRNIMIEEFILRYDLEADEEKINAGFPPERSWRALDIALTKFGKSRGVETQRKF